MGNPTHTVSRLSQCPPWCDRDHDAEPVHAGITELSDGLAVVVGSTPGTGPMVDIIGAPCETSEAGVTMPADAAARLAAVLAAVSGDEVLQITQGQLDSMIAARMARETRRYQAQIDDLQRTLRERAAGLVPA